MRAGTPQYTQTKQAECGVNLGILISRQVLPDQRNTPQIPCFYVCILSLTRDKRCAVILTVLLYGYEILSFYTGSVLDQGAEVKI
jgi:hypothetical protein